MADHTNYHLAVPANCVGTAAEPAIQAAATAHNAAVDANGPSSAEAIAARKTFAAEMQKGLLEIGIDLAKAESVGGGAL